MCVEMNSSWLKFITKSVQHFGKQNYYFQSSSNKLHTLQVCDHLKRVERRLGLCVHRASTLITAAVENAAKKNALLFAKTVQLLRNSTSSKRPMNASELAALLQGTINDIQICI